MAYQSYTKENKFSDEFKEKTREHGAYSISTVASLYMSGQPDLTITSKYGMETKAELKIYRGLEMPDRAAVIKLLRGPQINVITIQLWRRNANCIVIAQIGAKLDTCCIVSKHKVSFALWVDAAKILATLPFGQYTPWQE
jgi:hypothetical protein